jgi:hypothetical protein
LEAAYFPAGHKVQEEAPVGRFRVMARKSAETQRDTIIICQSNMSGKRAIPIRVLALLAEALGTDRIMIHSVAVFCKQSYLQGDFYRQAFFKLVAFLYLTPNRQKRVKADRAYDSLLASPLPYSKAKKVAGSMPVTWNI